MRIYGEDNFIAFQLLLDKVVEKSEIGLSLKAFQKSHLEKLSDKIKKELNQDLYPIGAATLRDYRYMYLRNPKYPFRAEREKLDRLTEYINEDYWEDFKSKYFEEAKEGAHSFYAALDVYADMATYAGDLGTISLQNAQYIKQDPSNPAYLFNLAICQLCNREYKEATRLLRLALDTDSTHPGLHHFMALSLFAGIRPFRHHKLNIDLILEHLEKALSFESTKEDTLYLKRIVQTDFHDRIGYGFEPTVLPEEPSSTDMIDFFSKCMGMTSAEIKTLLL